MLKSHAAWLLACCPALPLAPLVTHHGRQVYAHALHRVAERIDPQSKIVSAPALPCDTAVLGGDALSSLVPLTPSAGAIGSPAFASYRGPLAIITPTRIRVSTPTLSPTPPVPSMPPLPSMPSEPATPASSAPEPAAWALLTIGFAAIGLRTRGRRVVAA